MITKELFVCEFCGFYSLAKQQIAAHEAVCLRNPHNKYCESCSWNVCDAPRRSVGLSGKFSSCKHPDKPYSLSPICSGPRVTCPGHSPIIQNGPVITDLELKQPAPTTQEATNTITDHQRVIDYFHIGWERVHGARYIWEGPDIKAVQRLLKKLPAAEIIRRIDNFLMDRDPFVCKRGHLFRDFASTVNAYVNPPDSPRIPQIKPAYTEDMLGD